MRFIGPCRNGEKKESEIDALLPAAVKLRARLREPTEAGNAVFQFGETYLASFASDALLQTKDANTERFKLLRELNLEHAAHSLPKPDPERDANWTSAAWSPAPRIGAAQALSWLTHFERDEQAFAAIEKLARDPVPAVRFLVIGDMWRLGERYADKLWPLLGKIVETEENPVVLQGATRALWNLSRRDPASAAGVVRSLMRRVSGDDEEGEDRAQTNLIQLVVAYSVVHDAAWAPAMLADWRKAPLQYSHKLGISGRRLIEYLKPYNFEREHPVFLRAQTELLAHLDATAAGIAELNKAEAKLEAEPVRKKLRQLYEIVNHAVMWTYFSSDVDPKLRQRTEYPLDDVRRERFFYASLPVLDKVIGFGTKEDTGMMLAPTALVVEIDAVGSEALERAFHDFFDVLGSAGHTAGFEVEAKLGRDPNFVAEGSQRFADQILVGIGTVDFGRVEEGHSLLVGSANEFDALVPRRRRGVVGADAHAARADFRDLECAESSGLEFVASLARNTRCGPR